MSKEPRPGHGQKCRQTLKQWVCAWGAGGFLTPTALLLCLRIHIAAHEPITSTPAPGQCPKPCPRPPPKKSSWRQPTMADVGPPKSAPPDGGLAAFQRRLCCIIYRQEITDKRLTKEEAVPLLWGVWHHKHWCCQDPSHWGHTHLPGRGVGHILVWGCPKAEPEMIPLCALLWSCCLPGKETPEATAQLEQGKPGSSI